jgi:hypothetical protein
MEKNTLEQKLLIVQYNFPVGSQVCNNKIGTVGTVTSLPLIDMRRQKIFLSVMYDSNSFFEDFESLLLVKSGVTSEREIFDAH